MFASQGTLVALTVPAHEPFDENRRLFRRVSVAVGQMVKQVGFLGPATDDVSSLLW